MSSSIFGLLHNKLKIRPGLRLGDYPQRRESKGNHFEQACYKLYRRMIACLSHQFYSQRHLVLKINCYQQALIESSEAELTEAIHILREELQRYGLQRKLIIKAFAVIREVSGRTLGKRHFDVQLFGGWIMINGKLSEMETGEGKTLTTSLCACTAALAGIPVHVITVNDYLAARDADTIGPLYERLGLQVAVVIDGTDLAQRKINYQSDIVHTTNKQIAFDYLHDRIEIADDTGALRFQYRQVKHRQQSQNVNPLLLRGLCFGLIDEADSVLIDEAITPLIITKSTPNEIAPEHYADALHYASILNVDIDFKIDLKDKTIELTSRGEDNLADLMITWPKFWHNSRRCKIFIKQALAASHLFKKGEQYIVSAGKVQIIDQSTGRTMVDRRWEQGLHQMIETKESCDISDLREPQACISYQRLFNRYLHLAGTSGTISEVASELQSVYSLDFIKVATHIKPNRKLVSESIFRDDAAKKQAILSRVQQLFDQRRAVLIGTRSVEESEYIGDILTSKNIPHRLLNAKQDKHEAEIIAQAGQARAITVATNMAGRGTDITVSEDVIKLGGLHVIALYRNDARRIDRQLYGRCARQGDPGSVEVIISFDDPLLVNYYSSTLIKLLVSLTPKNKPLFSFVSRLVLRLPQRMKERQQAQLRGAMMTQDLKRRRILAFSGKFD